MSQEKALAIRLTDGVMTPTTVGEALEVAKMIADSGMVPKQFDGKPGAVLIAIQMGAEIGLSMMQSLQNIAVINGRPSLWGDAMLAVVLAHKDCEGVDERLDGTTAYCTVKRKGREIVERSFSWDDAKKAGLANKPGPWTQYPKRMLQMRARGFALRDSFPDALGGFRTAEETLDDAMVFEAKLESDPITEGVHSVRARKERPGKQPLPTPEPELEITPDDFPPINPAHGPVPTVKQKSEKEAAVEQPAPSKTKAQREKEWREKNSAEKKQQGESRSEPRQKDLVPDLRQPELEYLGMVNQAANLHDLDLLVHHMKDRKFTQKAKATILEAIELKRVVYQELGKEEPGADG